MVKVCGITNQEDATAAEAAGADALGFNFYPRSPRYVTPEAAGAIRTTGLRVGVFVDESPEAVAAAARLARLDVVQLHGSERVGDYLPMRVWKAFRVTLGEADGAEAVLLDGPVPGTGQTFDWDSIAATQQRLILAGGLGPDNVGEAIRRVRPWGVDACSRIESTPGRKDHNKMRQFIEAAHRVVEASRA
jgi:phosphoribosylanthranilate isomerase